VITNTKQLKPQANQNNENNATHFALPNMGVAVENSKHATAVVNNGNNQLVK